MWAIASMAGTSLNPLWAIEGDGNKKDWLLITSKMPSMSNVEHPDATKLVNHKQNEV